MTGQELINWIKENHAEEIKVVVQYRDLELGGMYPGWDKEIAPEINESCGREIIVL